MSTQHTRLGLGGRDVTRYLLLAVAAAVALAMAGLGSAAIYEKTGHSGSDCTMSGGTFYYNYLQAPQGQDYVFYGHGYLTYRVPSNKYASFHVGCYDSVSGFQSAGGSIKGDEGRYSASASISYSGTALTDDGSGNEARSQLYIGSTGMAYDYWYSLMVVTGANYTISGTIGCLDKIQMYIYDDTWKLIINDSVAGDSAYNYDIVDGYNYKIIFDGAYYDFTCTGNEVFDYDTCLWVYGYTCGVDSIKLYLDDGGSWVLDDTESQSTGYDVYEMQIVDGEGYKISFVDSTIDGDFVVHNQTFACTGDHVNIDFDRCEWIYPPYPPAPPIPIYVWTGYDYNIVVFRDEHRNFIENSQLAIYDKTDSHYLQRWTDASEGYTLLGARFATDHDVLLSLRTFDGIFTLDTTYPANGSSEVGEENITTTNWTIPIKYNLNVLPVDQYGVAMFDVFCGLSEYTPLNPGAFWGMDLSDRGYVPVTNCSGFAMCDIIAEKEGYADYKVEALNWTSKSALVKDYRHNIVMEEE